MCIKEIKFSFDIFSSHWMLVDSCLYSSLVQIDLQSVNNVVLNNYCRMVAHRMDLLLGSNFIKYCWGEILHYCNHIFSPSFSIDSKRGFHNILLVRGINQHWSGFHEVQKETLTLHLVSNVCISVDFFQNDQINLLLIYENENILSFFYRQDAFS